MNGGLGDELGDGKSRSLSLMYLAALKALDVCESRLTNGLCCRRLAGSGERLLSWSPFLDFRELEAGALSAWNVTVRDFWSGLPFLGPADFFPSDFKMLPRGWALAL